MWSPMQMHIYNYLAKKIKQIEIDAKGKLTLEVISYLYQIVMKGFEGKGV